jgi:hypothetical protein
MSDLYFKKFYNDVKDSSWHDVKNYADFLTLPDNIRNECIDVHHMQQRIDQIENPVVWQTILTRAFQYKNLAYIPVAKCASTYYITLFTQLGWKEVNITNLDSKTVCFGIFDEPFPFSQFSDPKTL